MIERDGIRYRSTFADVAANLGSAASEDYADGSNADGRWLRIGDIQICWTTPVNMGSVQAAGAGTFNDPYRTNGVSIDWPQAFTSTPNASATFTPVASGAPTLQNRGLFPAHFEPASTTGWAFVRAMTNGTADFDVELTAMAIGLWQ